MYEVYNIDNGAFDYTYMIIRDCRKSKLSPGYWYYGADNDLKRCRQIADEIGNGVVVRSEDVVALPFNH